MLDEPTQGLSLEETDRAVQILKGMLSAGNLSVILVEHDMEVGSSSPTTSRSCTAAASSPTDRPRRSRQCRRAQRLPRRLRVMLRLEGLHTYYGHGHILQGVDLEVPAGRIAAVLGRNGVGKTTTMRSIVGLTPPRSGKVLIGEQNVAGWPPTELCGWASATCRKAG